jgi:hypothetical protein
MIRLPEPIDEELVHRAQMEARRKSLPAIANVRVEVFDEGAGPRCSTSARTPRSPPRSRR